MTLFLPPGEQHKTVKSVERLLREMVRAGGDRGSLLIAFGGGIVGDVGGFVAATFMRGINYVQVPTTFLAQVDSSVGGKVGVNLPEGKNLVGNFLQPRAVFADIGVLGTLPDRELRAGLMESVKAGFIRDRALVRFMEEHAEEILAREPRALEKVIAASIRMKAEVVRKDERESGLRMILNFGHTVGHALEQATQVQGDAAWRGCGMGDGGDAGCGAEAGNDYRRTDGADGKADLSVRTAAKAEGDCGARDGGDGKRQEKCGRGKAVRAAGGDWRRGSGGGCDGGGAGGGSEVHVGEGKDREQGIGSRE